MPDPTTLQAEIDGLHAKLRDKEKIIVFADNGSVTGDDLLTAIEAATALEAKETKDGS